MKIKKAKHVKRWANFYRMNYEFHQPYKIVIDGNFLKIVLDRQMKLKEYLKKWLKGNIWIYVSSCVLQELNNLGEDFRHLFEEAKTFPKLKCGHIEGVPPNECLKSLIGDTNEQKFWVCTQDSALRQELKKLPGVPLFYFQQDVKLDLEEPAQNIKKMIEQKEKDKFLPSKKEQKEIKPLLKEQKQQEIEKQKKVLENEKRLLAAVVKKQAKGPNPLSIKKKQIKISENHGVEKASQEQSEHNDQKQKKQRTRNRVRSKMNQKEQQKNQQNEQKISEQ